MKCFICLKILPGFLTELKNHFIETHKIPFIKADARGFFLCCENNCNCSFSTFLNFSRHCVKKHLKSQNILPNTNNQKNDEIFNSEFFVYEESDKLGENSTDPKYVKEFINHCFSELRGNTNIPESIIKEFHNKCKEVAGVLAKLMKNQTINFLKSVNISLNNFDVLKLLNSFDVSDLFKQSSTFERQLNNLKKRGIFVQPKEIFLGRRIDNFFRDSKTVSKSFLETFQYISVKETLINLVNNTNFLLVIEKTKKSDNKNILKSYLDSKDFEENLFIKKYPTAIRLNLYYDDIEVANPLGSKATFHKLAVFYFTIQNFPPQLNSCLNNIFLLAVAYTEDIKKYGINKILKPLVDDLKLLESDEGIQVKLQNETNFILRASLINCLGDNLAMHELLGFSSPSSELFCRHCKAKRSLFKENYRQSFPVRTESSHSEEIALINSNEKYSKIFGVKFDSILNETYFHSTNNYCFDPMHDLLEGIVPLEIKLVLNYFILEEKLMSIETFNSKINLFHYGFVERKNKPSPNFTVPIITSKANKIKQSATQTWLLLRCIPFIFFDKITSKSENFILILIQLIRILEIIYCETINYNMISELKELLYLHHDLFKVLFPNKNMINKHHYILHYPECIIRKGPLWLSSCLRYESKHSLLKHQVVTARNFKNVPKSIAKRQALVQNTYITSSLFETNTVEIKSYKFLSKSLLMSREYIEKMFPNLLYIKKIFSLELDNVEYRSQLVVTLSNQYQLNESSFPSFAIINEIFECESVVFFNCTRLTIKDFIDNLNAFEIDNNSQNDILYMTSNEILDRKPNVIWKVSGKPSKYIPVKYRY